jgi:hypothetical protein
MTNLFALTSSLVGSFAAFAAATHSFAEITPYVNNESGWLTAAGAVTTVDFVENSPPGYVYFDHYAASGVIFTRGGEPFNPAVPWWYRFDRTTDFFGPLISDNGGIASAVSQFPLGLRFTAPIHAFAFKPLDLIGPWGLTLYRSGVQIGGLVLGGLGPTHRGFYSDEAFDEVRFNGARYLDNIYFQTVPAPGVLAAIAIAMPMVGRRRRRGC